MSKSTENKRKNLKMSEKDFASGLDRTSKNQRITETPKTNRIVSQQTAETERPELETDQTLEAINTKQLEIQQLLMIKDMDTFLDHFNKKMKEKSTIADEKNKLINELKMKWNASLKIMDDQQKVIQQLEEERQTMREKIIYQNGRLHEGEETSKIMDRFMTECVKNQEKFMEEFKNLTKSQQEVQVRTYAETTTTNLQQTQKPTIIVTAKNKETNINLIQKKLNKINTKEFEKINCLKTKQGQLLIQCQNKQDFDKLKEKIDEEEEMKQLIRVDEQLPRRQRIIIFGAPNIFEAGDEELNEEEREEIKTNYIETKVKPSLEKEIRQKIEMKHIKTIKNKANKETNHIVLETTENIAQQLIRTKSSIGFYKCTIQRHFTIIRCFKCQKLGHTILQCENNKRCGYCAETHEEEQCDRKNPPKCINCTDSNTEQERIPPSMRRIRINARHPSYDGSCPSYRNKLEEIIKRTSKNKNIQQKH